MKGHSKLRSALLGHKDKVWNGTFKGDYIVSCNASCNVTLGLFACYVCALQSNMQMTKVSLLGCVVAYNVAPLSNLLPWRILG